MKKYIYPSVLLVLSLFIIACESDTLEELEVATYKAEISAPNTDEETEKPQNNESEQRTDDEDDMPEPGGKSAQTDDEDDMPEPGGNADAASADKPETAVPANRTDDEDDMPEPGGN